VADPSRDIPHSPEFHAAYFLGETGIAEATRLVQQTILDFARKRLKFHCRLLSGNNGCLGEKPKFHQ
jgi:hypothetical protein